MFYSSYEFSCVWFALVLRAFFHVLYSRGVGKFHFYIWFKFAMLLDLPLLFLPWRATSNLICYSSCF